MNINTCLDTFKSWFASQAVTVFAAAYTLVAGVVERQKPAQPLRLAYFTPPAAGFTSPNPAP